MTEFCTIVGDLRTSLWASANGGAGTLHTRLDAQLAAASTALATAATQLGTLPEATPSGGPAAVSKLVGRLTDLHDDTAAGRESLSALSPNSTDADLGQVMGTIWPKVASLAGDPLEGIALTDAMKAAATDLSCRSLPGLG